MKTHKITIVTPSFNQAPFIEQTIDSVLAQNYRNLEYIVIDGGSTDGSVEIIEKYKKHLSYWISEKDYGQSHAINKGFIRATGEIINWLNSDDWLNPGALDCINHNFNEPGINVVSGRSNIILNDSIITQTKGVDVYAGNLPKTIGWARIDQPETFFRKKVIDELGFLNEQYHYIMDKDLWIRYLIRFGLSGVKKIDNILANFRWHEDSKSHKSKQGFVLESDYLAYRIAVQNNFDRKALERLKELLQIGQQIISDANEQYLVSNPLVQSAINYYALYKSDEAYYRLETEKSRQFLYVVDPTQLNGADRSLYYSLFIKGLFFPKWLLKLVRKWR